MVSNKFCKRFSFILLIFVTAVLPCAAQQFDYHSHPRLNFRFQELKLDLHINPGEKLLEGRAEYRLQANISGVDSLILHAAHMDIEQVRLDGEPAEFRLGNDSLFVGLNRSSMSGNSYTLEIMYRTEPKFGIHFEADSIAWTSFLPKSTQHWLPVVDHPRVRFRTDITLTVPRNLTALAPGRKSSEEVLSSGDKRVRWVSRRAIPVTAVWFAVGPFHTVETSIGVKRIAVSGLTESDNIRQRILEEAYGTLDRLQDELDHEFPFEVLHAIVLDDHRWETKSYGAGAVFLFRDQRSLTAQLSRGLYAQWYGVYQREEHWSDAEAINLHQIAVHYSLFDSAAVVKGVGSNPSASVDPYYSFSLKNWNRWQRFYPTWDDTVWKEVIEARLPVLLADGEGVKGWDDYARVWYRDTGQPWFLPPQLSMPTKIDTAETDSITYEVEYRYDEMSGKLSLGFRALDSVVAELVTLPLIQYSGDESDTLEVTFTGRRDSVLINLDPPVSYVTIDASAKEGLYLNETKPVAFLLNRLRGSAPSEVKVEAARQLGRHADNPDLQLAIADLLSRESDERVKAALYRSLGEITQGAAGTEQAFLNLLDNDTSPAVRKSAIWALRFYRNNEQVVNTLGSFALNSDSLGTFKLAVNSYLAAADSASVKRFSQQVLNSDSTGFRSVYVLEKIEEGERYVPEIKNIDILTGEEYPYSVRARALRLLSGVDESGDRWKNRIIRLLGDGDPRIRFIAVRAAARTGLPGVQSLLRERLLDEYDGRVFHEMEKAVNSNE